MKTLLQCFIAAILTAAFAVFVLDWTGGCGESFVYADGSRHPGECTGRVILKSILKSIQSGGAK